MVVRQLQEFDLEKLRDREVGDLEQAAALMFEAAERLREWIREKEPVYRVESDAVNGEKERIGRA